MGRINMRYIVTDVQKAVTFYTQMLGFQVEMQPAPGFAALSRDGIRLLLNEPGSGGAGQAIAGGEPAPGGWNRIQIEVDDLAETAKRLKHAGCSFRGEIEQIELEIVGSESTLIMRTTQPTMAENDRISVTIDPSRVLAFAA